MVIQSLPEAVDHPKRGTQCAGDGGGHYFRVSLLDGGWKKAVNADLFGSSCATPNNMIYHMSGA